MVLGNQLGNFVSVGLRERTYLNWRALPTLLLLLHLGIRLIFPAPSRIADLIIYNAVAFVAAATCLKAPLFNSRFTLVSASLGIASWALGSTISTWQAFYTSPDTASPTVDAIVNGCYTAFYPCLIIALFSSTSLERRPSFTQFLDSIISSLGISALIAASFIKRAMLTFDGSASTVFFTLLFPAGDVVMLALSILYYILLPKSPRTLLLMLGCAIFATTDIYFLWKSAVATYPFASLVDDGWLLGLIIIVESLWHRPKLGTISDAWSSASTTIASILATGILAISALHPSTFIVPVILLAISTIALSFLRMMVALRAARNAKDDRELAHRDELTGLANRRRFMFELALLESESGAEGATGTVLLLDLDGFKPINDSAGHDAGDQLLQHIARRFTRALPQSALVARLGGDEFGVIIYGDQHDGIEASHALLACLSYPIHLLSGSVKVGASIGRIHNDGLGNLLKRCDEAMYFAKRHGGGVMNWAEDL